MVNGGLWRIRRLYYKFLSTLYILMIDMRRLYLILVSIPILLSGYDFLLN